jgi:hypothetical protein
VWKKFQKQKRKRKQVQGDEKIKLLKKTEITAHQG